MQSVFFYRSSKWQRDTVAARFYQSLFFLTIYLFYPFILEQFSKALMRLARPKKTIVIQPNASKTPQKNSRLKSELKYLMPPSRHIIEVTQQYDSNCSPTQPEAPKSQTEEETQSSPSKLAQATRFLTCLTNLWKYLRYPKDKFEITANDTQFAKVISQLRSRKQCYTTLLPPQKQPKKVLVLDLDETLIHTTFNKPEKYDFESQVMFGGIMNKIYTIKRFGLDAFLFEMSQLYEIILFTASQKLYADKIIDQIDPKKRIAHRLYRQHCIVLNKSAYLKNLNLLGRNVKDIIIVDDNNMAGILQPQNFYKIEPFQGNQKDRQLCRLSAFLKHIHPKSQMLPIRQQRKTFQEMEIKVQIQTNGDKKFANDQTPSRKERKKQYTHKATNSEIENLVCDNYEMSTEAETTASDLIKSL